jgi:hypothetical protein
LRKLAGNTGSSRIVATMINNGTIEALSGTLAMLTSSHTGTATSVYTASAGATLQFGSSHTLAAGSSITGGGDVQFTGGTTSVNGSYSVTGLTVIETAVNFETSNTVAALTLNGANIGGTGAVAVSGLLTWANGTWGGTGTTTLNGGMLANGNSTRTLSRDMTLASGTATFIGPFTGMTIGAGATFTNDSTIEFAADNGSTQNLSGTGTFLNNGTLRKQAGNTGSTSISVATINNGIIESLSANLAFSNSFTQAAGVTRLAGGSMSSSQAMNI